ncbi:MAG: ATP-binding protein [Candidatus Bathyarchaeia archaeon]
MTGANLEAALSSYVDYAKDIELVPRDITIPEVNFINAIIGPRRSGKTSLMLLFMKGLDVEKGNKVFINCEDVGFVGVTAKDLGRLEEAIFRVYEPDETKDIYLFIDEVQTFPEWSRWVRTLFDRRIYRIFITGSTSELSLDRLPSELRGRAVNTLVLPFSFKEYLRVKGLSVEDYMKPDETAVVVSDFLEYLEFGGYPEIVKSEGPSLKRQLLSELYATVIQRDLVERHGIRKAAAFRIFVNSLFSSACRDVSIPAIVSWFTAQGNKISGMTALNYLNYSQSAFLFFLVYPYSRKIKERNVKPKLYVSDSGILGLFDSDRGKWLENAVFVELMRRRESVNYYRSRSADVDFVLSRDNKPIQLIQVCYSINDPGTYSREVGSLLEAGRKLGCTSLTVITFNEERTITWDGNVIDVRPAWKWFLN